MAETTEQVTTEQTATEATQPATGTDPAKNATPEATFTQADVERLIKERLERERKATRDKYADYPDLKAAAAKLQEIEDANKSEAEKAAERVAKLEAQLQEQADQNARLESQRVEMLQQRAVENEANKQGFTDPSDAWALLDKSKLTVNEDGALEGVEDAVKALAEAKPHLLKTQPQMAPTNPGRGAQVGETDNERRRRLLGGGGSPIGTAQGGGVLLSE